MHNQKGQFKAGVKISRDTILNYCLLYSDDLVILNVEFICWVGCVKSITQGYRRGEQKVMAFVGTDPVSPKL